MKKTQANKQDEQEKRPCLTQKPQRLAPSPSPRGQIVQSHPGNCTKDVHKTIAQLGNDAQQDERECEL